MRSGLLTRTPSAPPGFVCGAGLSARAGRVRRPSRSFTGLRGCLVAVPVLPARNCWVLAGSGRWLGWAEPWPLPGCSVRGGFGVLAWRCGPRGHRWPVGPGGRELSVDSDPAPRDSVERTLAAAAEALGQHVRDADGWCLGWLAVWGPVGVHRALYASRLGGGGTPQVRQSRAGLMGVWAGGTGPMRREPGHSNRIWEGNRMEDMGDFTFSDVTPPDWPGLGVNRGVAEPTSNGEPLARRWFPRQGKPDPAWVTRDNEKGTA